MLSSAFQPEDSAKIASYPESLPAREPKLRLRVPGPAQKQILNKSPDQELANGTDTDTLTDLQPRMPAHAEALASRLPAEKDPVPSRVTPVDVVPDLWKGGGVQRGATVQQQGYGRKLLGTCSLSLR